MIIPYGRHDINEDDIQSVIDVLRSDFLTQGPAVPAFDLIRMLDAEGYPNAFLNIGPFKLEFTRASRKTEQVVADIRISLSDNINKRDK